MHHLGGFLIQDLSFVQLTDRLVGDGQSITLPSEVDGVDINMITLDAIHSMRAELLEELGIVPSRRVLNPHRLSVLILSFEFFLFCHVVFLVEIDDEVILF